MSARISSQNAVGARNLVRQGVDTDALLTAAQWHRALFREPPPRQFTDDVFDDDDAVAV
jgi:hypothetical protein